MSGLSATDQAAAPDQTVGGLSKDNSARPIGRLFPTIMEAARRWWPHKAAAELAAIIGCDVRSAERYLAGDRTAGAEAVLAILCSDVGDRLITAAVATMPEERQLKFWEAMAKSARRAQLVADRARIEAELLRT